MLFALDHFQSYWRRSVKHFAVVGFVKINANNRMFFSLGSGR